MAFSQVLTCFGLLPAPCPSFFPPGQEALLPHQLSLCTMMELKQHAGAVAVQDGATSNSPVVEGTEDACAAGPEASILRLLLWQDLYLWAT